MSPVQNLASTAASAATAPTPARVGGLAARPEAGDAKQAAKQFEAIILRQLLEPVMQPAMSGLGGSEGSGNSIYGYMLTDAMANQLAQGGGLGLSKMLEKEFTPKGADTSTQVTTSAALKLHPLTSNPRE